MQADKITQQQALDEMENGIGFVPNLLREMSVSPAAPLVYTRSDELMHENAVLPQKDQQVVQLVASLFNECHYCSSMHSKFSNIHGVEHEDVLAIRNKQDPQEERVANLAWTTQTILEKRGHLSKEDLQKIEGMGITRPELYEILVHIGRKMITTYAAHILNPELDEMFVFEE